MMIHHKGASVWGARMIDREVAAQVGKAQLSTFMLT